MKILTVLFLVSIIFNAKASKQPDNKEKIRILVDKVFMRNKERLASKEKIQLVKDSGFNVFCPRKINPEQMETFAKHCKQANIDFALWTRGSVPNKTDSDDDKMVWYANISDKLYSPNSDKYWEVLTERIMNYAKFSKKHKNMKGIMIDFENYSTPKERSRIANCFHPSYDKNSMLKFLKNKKVKIPAGADVKSILKITDKHKNEYINWQIKLWRKRSRELRRKIDEYNPDLVFFVYPGGGNPFLKEFISAMKTKRAPVYAASSFAYYKSKLVGNKDYIDALSIKAQNPYVKGAKVLAGIDTSIKENTPTFASAKAAAASQKNGGYWVFFDSRLRKDEFRLTPNLYMDAFKKANAYIVQGKRMPYNDSKTTVMKINKPGLPQISIIGDMRRALKKFFSKHGKYEFHDFSDVGWENVSSLDLLIIQGAKVDPLVKKSLEQKLKSYVKSGGLLILTYRTLTAITPFPEIVKSARKNKVTNKYGKYIIRDRIRTITDNKKLALRFKKYYANYPLHIPMIPGTEGNVLIKNRFGDATLVTGKFGKGTVVYISGFMGRRSPPIKQEAEMLKSVIAMLTKQFKKGN